MRWATSCLIQKLRSSESLESDWQIMPGNVSYTYYVACVALVIDTQHFQRGRDVRQGFIEVREYYDL